MKNKLSCPVTGKQLPDGYYLHPELEVQLLKTVRRLPGLYDDALRHIGGASKAGDGMTGASSRGDRILWPALTRLQEAEQWVKAAALYAGAGRADSFQTACDWLIKHSEDVLHCKRGSDAYWLARRALRRLQVLVDRQPARTLVLCGECDCKNYVTVGRVHAYCHDCGSALDVAGAYAEQREQAQYAWMSKRLAVEFVEMATGVKVSDRRLKYLREKGLVGFAGSPVSPVYQPNQIMAAINKLGWDK